MKTLTFLLCVIMSFSVAKAQENQRKKVGVVLSGGGAKGLAHIGVLKVLEENGVKVDYIAGTSMGAIIGGLYASGYTASELDSIFKNVDTEALLQDYIPRISKSFYEKRNDEIYALQLPFDDFKIGMPAALSKGMYNYNLLSGLLLHVRHERDFNKLAIPFLCIATDIESGKQVILDKGILPQSILASGAFPSLYSPVEIDGRLLIDGGVANNYPIDELRKMGAEIIIGVDVQDGLKNREDIRGASDILLQISNFSMVQDMSRKIRETDIYIKPDIKGYSVISFREGSDIIKKGIEAAAPFTEEFKKMGDPEYINNPSSFREKYKGDLCISRVEINEMENFTSNYVYGKLKFTPNTTLTFDNFSTGINNMNGTQNFSSIVYSFAEEDGGDVLKLNLKEAKTQRYLKFGLHFDNLYKSAALVNVTQKKLLFKNDVISLDLGVGDQFRYNLNYYVDNGYRWSVGFQSKLNKISRNINRPITNNFIELPTLPNSLSLDLVDVTNRLYFQTFYRDQFLVAVGLEHKFNQVDIKNLIFDMPWIDKSHYLSAYGNIVFDTYDNKYFPRKGVIFNAEYKNYFHSSDYIGNFKNFSQINAELGTVRTFFDKVSVEAKAEIGATLGSESTSFLQYFFGGYGFQSVYNVKQFYGYDFLSVFDDSYIKVLFRVDYEVFNKHHLNIAANYAQIGNNIFQYSDWISKPKFNGYAIGYGYQAIIGPIEIKHSWSPDTGNHYTWFSVGFWF